ncbi:MAG TPA: hypothetical protein VIL30_01670 [Ramlibacter sp.]
MLIATLASAAPSYAQDKLAQTKLEVVGSWVSPFPIEVPSPAGGTAYLVNSLVFTADRETLQVEAFADAQLNEPIFTYQSSGPYEIIGLSKVVTGAVEANLVNETATVTIHVDAPEIWQGLNLGDCPLERGIQVNIKECVSGPPFISAVCVDQDLIHIEADRLRFGEQDTDRCVTRPITLDADSYVRVAE